MVIYLSDLYIYMSAKEKIQLNLTKIIIITMKEQLTP